MPRSKFRPASVWAGLLLAGCLQAAWAAPLAPEGVGAEFVAKANIRLDGKFQSGLRFSDKAGDHLLVLSAKDYPSRQGGERDRIDSHQLSATLYRLDSKGAWKRQWLIRDGVVCPDLDSEATFLREGLTITDLDDDHVAEVTIPYRTFCGGGVDTKNLRVVLRTGPLKFSIRGQSTLLIPGQAPIGGEHQQDAALAQPQYRPYREHLERIWLLVSAEKLGAPMSAETSTSNPSPRSNP